MKIVISGASGTVGSSVIPHLLDEGHSLLLISRNPHVLQRRYPELKVASLQSWESSASGYDVFVHLAVLNNDQDGRLEQFLSVNAELTALFAEGARKAGIPRFVYPSTVLRFLLESPSHYVLSKLEGERRASRYYPEGLDVIHLGFVHGATFPRNLSALNRVPRFVGRFVFSVLSSVKPTTSALSIATYISGGGSLGDEEGHILTDDKMLNVPYRVWQYLINWSFVVAVALFSPVISLIWLSVVLDDGRPGFFIQDRLGQNLRIFRCFKFRTMRRDTQTDATHRVSKNSITRVGSLLRKLKVDELPQAINVVRGEMNLVGPRPCLSIQHDVIQARVEANVFGGRPGLTGWSQIRGIDMEHPHDLARSDKEYLGLRSVWLDFYIILRTFSIR